MTILDSRMRKLTKWAILSLCCIFILLIEAIQPILAEPGTASAGDDETAAWPEKRDSRDTWEKIVSFPGTVIYLPLGLLFEANKAVIGYFYDRRENLKGERSYGIQPTYADRVGGGFDIFQKDLFSSQSRLTLSLSAGLKRRQRYQLRMERLSLFGGALLSDFLVGYQLLSDESFFGIGPDSRAENESGFAHRQVTVEMSQHAGLSKRVSLHFVAGIDSNTILESKDDDIPGISKRNLPGLMDRTEMGRLQIVVSRDSRDRPVNPSKGGHASLMAGLFHDLDGQFKFWRFSADLRHNIHLFYNRILSLRLAGEAIRPLADGDIPFYYLSELGRQETIRGFSRGRFRDRDMVLASVEYHYPVWRMANAMLFLDVGQVTHNIFSDISPDDLKFGYGGGIQIWGREKLITTLFAGKSRDELRFYFVLNQPRGI